MKKRYVNKVEKTMWNSQPQIRSLSGIEADGTPFTATVERASKEIRMGLADYYLWDGDSKAIQLMSVANYVEAIEYDEDLNLYNL